MSHIAHGDKPGKVVIVSQRGRARLGRKNFGSMVFIEGHMMMCIGYTEGGHEAVYAPVDTMKLIRGAVKSNEKKALYRILKRLISHYEIAV